MHLKGTLKPEGTAASFEEFLITTILQMGALLKQASVSEVASLSEGFLQKEFYSAVVTVLANPTATHRPYTIQTNAGVKVKKRKRSDEEDEEEKPNKGDKEKEYKGEL